MNQPAENALIEKIKGLRPERIAEVEDFVDFLKARDEECDLTHTAGALAEE